MKLAIINGPNLNLIGVREPEIYGDTTFERFFESLIEEYQPHDFLYFQSNVEGDIVTKIQETGFDYDGLIVNAGAYSHTSHAIADAIRSIESPVVEVHISNVYAREDFRHKSVLASACKGAIVGLGLEVYRLAIEYFVRGEK